MSDLCKSPWAEWETVRVIGRGSFGTVYEIRRRLVDGTVETAAMKVITLPQNPGDVEELRGEGFDDESITATFQSHLRSIVAEYTLMRKLDGSANVVNCKDIRYVQHDDGIGWDIFIRMELLTPLLKALPENVPEETVVRLGRDIASALVLCRKHSIIHRDIKPQNIFISDNADYKLGDFGIAKTVEKTMGGTKIGTYKYMAPEVYNNQPYGSGADIYSLGLVLYWLLNERRMPFMPLPPAKVLAGQDEQARQRRLSGEKLPPPAHGSQELKRIVLKSCAYAPKDRYHTADEMLEDLNRLNRKCEAATKKTASSIQQPPEAPPDDVEDATSSILEETVDADKTEGTVGVFSQKEETAAELPRKGGNKKQRSSKKLYATILGGVLLATMTVLAIRMQSGEKMAPTTPETEAVQIQATRKSSLTEDSTVQTEVDISAVGYANAEVLARSGENARAAMAFYSLGNYQDARQRSFALWDTVAVRDTVSAGSWRIVGLKEDGTVVASGWDVDGSCDVDGWSDIISVSAQGNNHTVGLRTDGTVVATGYNGCGQREVSDWSDIVSVVAGGNHTVGLRADGTVMATGYNGDGQCEVNNWTDIVAISASEGHTVGLKADGTVIATGRNEAGQCNVSDWTDIIAVSAGYAHTVGLKADGTVVAVGNNSSGECNVTQWENVTAISAGICHTVGLRADGTVVATGLNRDNVCAVSSWTDIVAVSTDAYHTAGLKSDGTVIVTGSQEGVNPDGSLASPGDEDAYYVDTSTWKDIKLQYFRRA